MQGIKRQANFELLRIIAMFMVVVMHYLYQSRALPENGRSLDGIAVSAVILESFCIAAVNVYVLISGYFLSATGFSRKRVLSVLVQTLFYTILIPAVLTAVGVLKPSELVNIYHIWNSIFPVQSAQYWFVTAYLVMCLFAPLLNAGLEKLEQKALRQVIFALLLLFSIGKTISPLQFAFDRYGYDFGWFLLLYLIGGYFRRYGFGALKNARSGFLLWISCAALTAGMEILLVILSGKIPALTYYASVPFHYNFLPCFLGAVGLFAAFSFMEIKEGKASTVIRRVSPLVFGVYLIHGQADVENRWFFWVNGLFAKIGLGQKGFLEARAAGAELAAEPTAEMAQGSLLRYLFILLIQVIFVFACCIMIDWLRSRLFSLFKRKKKDA